MIKKATEEKAEAMPTMIGMDYLNKIGGQLRVRLKRLARPLLKDGIGDRMDRGNLWIVPGFTLFAFSLLWCAKLCVALLHPNSLIHSSTSRSKLALAESTCKGASIYDFTGSTLDEDAKKHCQTANRYYVGINEPFSYDPKWREARQVKNPEVCPCPSILFYFQSMHNQ